MATKTVLITGSNSGIGKAAAILFSQRGWNVAATMRNVDAAADLKNLNGVRLYRLDVTDQASVTEAFRDVTRDFGGIDVVVNNAGYGLAGVFEEISDEALQRQFATNVLGLMRVTREAITYMRTRGAGTIVQISSMGGRMTFPLYAPYHATKWAVEGFSESLHYELKDLNIRLKLIEPGLIKTDFAGRSAEMVLPTKASVYDPFVKKFSAAAAKALKDAVDPGVVARVIVDASSDNSNKLRYPVGNPAPVLLRLRKVLSDNAFFGMIRKAYGI
ncbi:MAG: SDR family oxidoreductase [Candidatus Kapabacteria bacterium]|nr:SDR family oxidoreductase [Candidatus Kapabacteria bacterium]